LALNIDQASLGCTPHLVAADAGFYSAKNEAAAKAKGVKRVCIPNRSINTLSASASKRSVCFATARNGLRGSHQRGQTTSWTGS
jgi:IS5 family transposase